MTVILVKIGDLLDEAADVIISTANPWLNMSGGVNGAILLRGGETIQEELHAFIRQSGASAVVPGTVVVTGPGPLRTKHILHAVAIDPFYDSSRTLVRQTLKCAITKARELGALSVALPALATGYGHLSLEEFAQALAETMDNDWAPIEHVIVVLRTAEAADIVRRTLGDGPN